MSFNNVETSLIFKVLASHGMFCFCVFVGVISLSSNIVVLMMFVKFKALRTATNFIIINLAFTDIGVAGIGYPMSAASDLHGSWKFGYTGCQVGRSGHNIKSSHPKYLVAAKHITLLFYVSILYNCAMTFYSPLT